MSAKANKAPIVPKMELLEEHVNVLSLPVRIVNMLESAGIFTLSDLLQRTQRELMLLPNFNEKTLETILKALERVGFVATSRFVPGPDFVKAPSRRKRTI